MHSPREVGTPTQNNSTFQHKMLSCGTKQLVLAKSKTIKHNNIREGGWEAGVGWEEKNNKTVKKKKKRFKKKIK